jgi:hypothetical protein
VSISILYVKWISISYLWSRVENISAEEKEESIRRDAVAIQEVHNILRALSKTIQDTEQCTGEAGSITTVARRNLSQLVAVRRAHQTQRAVKSVKTRSNPQDSDQGSRSPTDHQRLCAQMAEVVRCAGTGLERGARWKSSLAAPGTRSLEESQSLTGNSANAEVAAKERVNTVRNSHLQGSGTSD